MRSNQGCLLREFRKGQSTLMRARGCGKHELGTAIVALASFRHHALRCLFTCGCGPAYG